MTRITVETESAGTQYQLQTDGTVTVANATAAGWKATSIVFDTLAEALDDLTVFVEAFDSNATATA